MSFATGHEVGALACSQVPGGVMVEAEPDLRAALDLTRKLVQRADFPIFEATFEHDGTLVRVDILSPELNSDGAVWHMYEVKSSGSAKTYHLGDLATQIWVLEQNGIQLGSASIRHIDTTFRLERHGDYEGIFRDAPLLADLCETAGARGKLVAQIRKVLEGSEPVCATGAHCELPFTCEFSEHCNSFEPEGPDWPISELPNTGARLAQKWAAKGVFAINELPDSAELNSLHSRICNAVRTGEVYLDSSGVRLATKDWTYPRIWLDFETIGFTIPRWIGTSPYQQVPFQFSAHVELEGGELEHVEALDVTGTDPRSSIAEHLAALPREGTVVAWNASFERRCLRNLAEACPDYREPLTSLADRTVDLLPVAKANYYHRDQRGSFSIKAVLPTLCPELSYADLAVADGGQAQLAYLEATSDICTLDRKAALESSLKEYCARDTFAMLEIFRKLSGDTA
jgi:hypothetical protein